MHRDCRPSQTTLSKEELRREVAHSEELEIRGTMHSADVRRAIIVVLDHLELFEAEERQLIYEAFEELLDIQPEDTAVTVMRETRERLGLLSWRENR